MNSFILNTIIVFLDIIYRPVFNLKHNLLETGLCLRLQVKPTQLGPIDIAGPCLRTPAPTQDSSFSLAVFW
jgi:hypothetical protein